MEKKERPYSMFLVKTGTVKGYKLVKKDGIPPTTKELLKGI